MRYNPPPNWPPAPPGWQPPTDWRPDPSWGPPPQGWTLWLDDAPTSAATQQPPAAKPTATTAAPVSKLLDAVKHPVWISIGTAVSVLGLVAGAVSYYQSQEEPGALQVGAVTVEGVTELQGAFVDPGGSDPTTVGAASVDITLKNDGDAPVTVTHIEAELVTVTNLENCMSPGAGPTAITAEYAVRLSTAGLGTDDAPIPAQPTVTSDTDFTIAPESVDRLVITVGPERQWQADAQLLDVRLRLVQDDGGKLDLPNIVLITTQDQVESYLDSIKNPPPYASYECVRRDLGKLDAALKTDGVHSSSVQQLRDAYAALAAR